MGCTQEEWDRMKANEQYGMYAKLDAESQKLKVRMDMLEEKISGMHNAITELRK